MSKRRPKAAMTPFDRKRGVWTRGDYIGGPEKRRGEPDTGVEAGRLSELLVKQTELPEDFHPHPKIKKFLEGRRKMAAGEQPLDWSAAEALAFASLSAEGVRVRLSGQDSARGTFSQRHAMLYDYETGQALTPVAAFGASRGRWTSSTARSRKPACWVLITVTAWIARTDWFAGRRSLGIFATRPKSLLTNSLPARRTNGTGSADWSCCCRMALKGRGRNIPAHALNAFWPWQRRTTSRSSARRRPRNISIACAGRCCGTGASRWWS